MLADQAGDFSMSARVSQLPSSGGAAFRRRDRRLRSFWKALGEPKLILHRALGNQKRKCPMTELLKFRLRLCRVLPSIHLRNPKPKETWCGNTMKSTKLLQKTCVATQFLSVPNPSVPEGSVCKPTTAVYTSVPLTWSRCSTWEQHRRDFSDHFPTPRCVFF